MFSKREYANKDMSAKDYVSLSTDAPLPTDGIINGSMCLEMDTGKFYVFDEEGTQWVELA